MKRLIRVALKVYYAGSFKLPHLPDSTPVLGAKAYSLTPGRYLLKMSGPHLRVNFIYRLHTHCPKVLAQETYSHSQLIRHCFFSTF